MNAARMSTFADRLGRWTRALLDGGARFVSAALCVGLGLAYFAVREPYLPWLRPLLPALGELTRGYEIEALQLELRVDPDRRSLSSTAQLQLRLQPGVRPPLAFLLDPGFTARQVVEIDSDGKEHALRHRQIGPVLAVALPGTASTQVTVVVRYTGRPLGLGRWRDARVGSDEVLLPPDALWYPTNARSFFSFQARAEFPANWELAHAATEAHAYERGRIRVWEWNSERAVSGLGLMAGSYHQFERSGAGVVFRVFARAGDDALANTVLDRASEAEAALRELLGNSGFPVFSLVLHPTLRRAFFDGAGVAALPRAALASFDHGGGLIAHELAHAWWGGSVGGRWLSSGDGGQWITESFAEVSSLLATEKTDGTDARVRRMTEEFWDPAYRFRLTDMTVLDNALGAPGTRETIYRKGAFVAWMLRSLIGEEPFERGLRALCERYRLQAISDREVQAVFEEQAKQPLDSFFETFVRGTTVLDFHVDAASGGDVEISASGTENFPGKVRLWQRAEPQAAWQEQFVSLPYRLPFAGGRAELLVDPLLEWADVQRENNRFPRRSDPQAVSVGEDQWLLLLGEPFPWSRQTAQLRDVQGSTRASWIFERNFLRAPQYDSEHGWFVAALTDPYAPLPPVLVLEADGSRRTIGRGSSPVVAKDGAVYAAAGDRVVRIGPSGRLRTVVRHPGARVEQLALQEADQRLAYVLRDRSGVQLYVLPSLSSEPQLVWQWEQAPVRIAWIPNEESLLVAAVDGAAWQLSELPLDGGPATPVARSVFALRDLALSPDGHYLALTALPASPSPRAARTVYVLDRTERTVRSVALAQQDFQQLAWEGSTALLAIAEEQPEQGPLFYPRRRTLYRIELPAGQPQAVALTP